MAYCYSDKRKSFAYVKPMKKFILAAAFYYFSIPALAHVVLDTPTAPPGSPYKLALKVTHGCEGSPTVSVKVKIPEGFIAVKPQPKPGWSIALVRGKYAKTYDFYHGAKLSEGVTEILWSGNQLPDEYFDEFVLSGFVARDLKEGTTLYFLVEQQCEKGTHRWIEIPASGKSAHDLKAPAPSLRIVPKR